MADSTGGYDSPPMLPEDSVGSSVSSTMQDEYNELLRFAVVVPSYDPSSLPAKIVDTKGSFAEKMQSTPYDQQGAAGSRHIHIHQEASSECISPSESGESTTEDEPRQQPPAPMNVKKPKPVAKDTSTPMKSAFLPSEMVASPESQSASEATQEDEGESKAYIHTIDPDVSRMETLLDQWTFDLKRNVLAELSQMKIMIIEHSKNHLNIEKERHAAEMEQAQNEMENLKELLHTYETSIQRKDEVISNLTRALQRHKEKFDMMRTFCDWRIKHNDTKREAFASNLARKHYSHVIERKAWDAWHSLIQDKWRNRVEKACQSKATEVCMGLTNDYEARIKSLNEALEASRIEVCKLQEERDKYEETMKKAFMRGVCALNLEAMNMFQEGEKKEFQGNLQDIAEAAGTAGRSDFEDRENQAPRTVPQEPVYYNPAPVGAPARVVTSQAATTSRTVSSQAKTSSTLSSKQTKTTTSTRPKVLSAKITAKSDPKGHVAPHCGSSSMGLAPPMSSVLVERHQPINKQTIGKAVASTYPKQSESQPPPAPSTIAFRKLAGQAGTVKLVNPNIQPVKIVE
ncbi:centrosomal protein POC5-like isoform X2 [Lineus longissimus]